MTGLLRAALLCAAILGWQSAAAHDCDPLAVNSGGVQIGTPKRPVLTTQAGTVDGWWCMYTNASTPAGKVQWRMQRIVNLNECRDLTRLIEGAGRVIASSAPMQQFETELRAMATVCVVQEGTQRHYEVQRLLHMACVDLTRNPPPGTPADWLKPADATATWQPSDWCGAAPLPPPPPPPPPPPAGVYIVSGTAAYPLRADGTRSTTAWPNAPAKGEACDCSVLILNPFGGRYCKVPRLSTATQTVVAGCTLKP